MLLGMKSGGGWKNPYKTEGLSLALDIIGSAKDGSSWVDIVSGRKIGQFSFNDDYAQNSSAVSGIVIPKSNNLTVEMNMVADYGTHPDFKSICIYNSLISSSLKIQNDGLSTDYPNWRFLTPSLSKQQEYSFFNKNYGKNTVSITIDGMICKIYLDGVLRYTNPIFNDGNWTILEMNPSKRRRVFVYKETLTAEDIA